MVIERVRISKVTVETNYCYDSLFVKMEFRNKRIGSSWSFTLGDPVEVQRLTKMMNYVGVSEVDDLERKYIRIVISYGTLGTLCGFGHRTQDKFVPLSTEEFRKITEKEFEEILKDS